MCSEIGVLRKYHGQGTKVMIPGQDKVLLEKRISLIVAMHGLLNGPLQLFSSDTVIKLLLGQNLMVLLFTLIFYFRGCH